MMILGENYDEYFGLDEYDPYDPCEGYEDDRDNEELEVIEELNEIFNLQEAEIMKKIDEKKIQVTYDFGSVAYVTVNIYEGKTLEECLKIKSEAIDGYIEDGKYTKIK